MERIRKNELTVMVSCIIRRRSCVTESNRYSEQRFFKTQPGISEVRTQLYFHFPPAAAYSCVSTNPILWLKHSCEIVRVFVAAYETCTSWSIEIFILLNFGIYGIINWEKRYLIVNSCVMFEELHTNTIGTNLLVNSEFINFLLDFNGALTWIHINFLHLLDPFNV